MINYAKRQPRDMTDNVFDGSPPAFPSNQSQFGVPVTSSVITLAANTTVVEMSATSGTQASGGIIFKWGTTSVTSTNFDGFVQSGATRMYVVPVSIMVAQASTVGANAANGLYPAVSVKNINGIVTSVITVEY